MENNNQRVIESNVIKVIDYDNGKNNDYIIIDKENLRPLEKGELLIKVMASTLTQFDILRVSGKTFVKCPFIPGLEGSGIVVDANLDEKETFINRRVSFTSLQGTVRDHIVLNQNEVYFLDENISYEDAALAQTNAFTAYGIVEIIKLHKVNCFIQDSANSSVAKIIYKLSKHYGIESINIVRSEESFNEMKSLGAEYVLNSNDLDFPDKLKELATKLKAVVAFDSLSGSIVGTILKAMPANSVLYNYGTQTQEAISGIDATDFRWGEKELKSHNNIYWMRNLNKKEKDEVFNFILKNHDAIFKQDIGKIYPMSDYLKAYEEKKKSKIKGRVVFTTISQLNK